MTIKKAFLVGGGVLASLVILAAIAIIGFGLGLGPRQAPGHAPLAPDAAEAPKAVPGEKNTAKTPASDWPTDFKLPDNVRVDAPEIPDALKEPAAAEKGGKK